MIWCIIFLRRIKLKTKNHKIYILIEICVLWKWSLNKLKQFYHFFFCKKRKIIIFVENQVRRLHYPSPFALFAALLTLLYILFVITIIVQHCNKFLFETLNSEWLSHLHKIWCMCCNCRLLPKVRYSCHHSTLQYGRAFRSESSFSHLAVCAWQCHHKIRFTVEPRMLVNVSHHVPPPILERLHSRPADRGRRLPSKKRYII